MEYVVNTMHGILDRLQISYITNVETDLICNIWHFYLEFMPHIILFFLITRKYANFADIRLKESIQNSITKRTCASCYK